MSKVLVFVTSCVLSGLFAALGSIVGNAFGHRGLGIGGVVGGLIGAFAAAAVCRGRKWIKPTQFTGTTVGAMIGFVIAAAIAVNTLSSPIGPILSTAFVGIGAIIGGKYER